MFSIVIVNWNGERVIGECLSHLLKQTYKNYECIVVDNASTDKSLSIINKFPNIKLIKNNTNYGFAKGNNIGFKAATGDLIALLNTDAFADSLWLESINDFFQKYKNVGIVASRQMFHDRVNVIESAYHSFRGDFTVDRAGCETIYSTDGPFSQPGYVISASGASAAYRKEVITQTNGFDETFISYFEDFDLCFRALLYRWDCLYHPEALVYHMEGASYKKFRLQSFSRNDTNRLLFLYKYFPLSMICSNIPILLFLELRFIRSYIQRMKNPLAYFDTRLKVLRLLHEYKEFRKIHVPLFNKNKAKIKRFMKQDLIPL